MLKKRKINPIVRIKVGQFKVNCCRPHVGHDERREVGSKRRRRRAGSEMDEDLLGITATQGTGKHNGTIRIRETELMT